MLEDDLDQFAYDLLGIIENNDAGGKEGDKLEEFANDDNDEKGYDESDMECHDWELEFANSIEKSILKSE